LNRPSRAHRVPGIDADVLEVMSSEILETRAESVMTWQRIREPTFLLPTSCRDVSTYVPCGFILLPGTDLGGGKFPANKIKLHMAIELIASQGIKL
jgi:hypothetical protein